MSTDINILSERGWVIIENAVEKNLLSQLHSGIDTAYRVCRDIQIKNGIAENTDGTVHHLLCFQGPFLEFLKQKYCNDLLAAFFRSPFILNTYGGVINLPKKASYVANVHRDIRTFYNIPMMINMLVMLDDFTEANGATYLLSGSHLKDEKPEDDFFYKNAERAIAPAGSVLLFDSLTWHAAGINTTEKPRKALTLAFTRPFMKQQLDYPRFLGYDKMNEFDDVVKQVIGYNSRIPSNLDEWYQKPENRFYKPGQG